MTAAVRMRTNGLRRRRRATGTRTLWEIWTVFPDGVT
jgi:hypothetical protein